MTSIPFENVEWTSAVAGHIHLSGREEAIHTLPVPAHWLSEIAPETRSWITRFTTELRRFGDLSRDWNSYGAEPPNQNAISSCTTVLEYLWDIGIKPSRIGPLADGGVFTSVVLAGGRLDVDCYNSGESSVRIRRTGEPTAMGSLDAELGINRGDIAAALRALGATPANASTWEDSRSSV